MALKTKIEFISQSRDGRYITVRDATGTVADDPTGYGPSTKSISDIKAHYLVVSRMSSMDDYVLKIDGSDPILPSNEFIALGNPFTLSTDLFKKGTYGSSKIFFDGVLDVNMYVEFEGMSNIIGAKGDNFIELPSGDIRNFQSIYDGDAICINDVIYQIDKNTDNHEYKILFIVGSLEDDATEFDYLYRANTKALLTSMGESLHNYACDRFRDNIESREWAFINTAASFRRAAWGFFTAEVPDYAKADDLAVSGMKLLRKYTI